MISTHTPGPWIIQPTSRAGNGSAWRDIVSTGTTFSPCYVSEALERDAQLIAAAPDLLAALQSVVARYAPTTSPADDEVAAMWRSARSAIAKAQGLAD